MGAYVYGQSRHRSAWDSNGDVYKRQEFTLSVSAVGYKSPERKVVLKRGKTLEENFELEEDMKSKKRNASEHKHLQNLITKKRQLMENEISIFASNGQNYEVYKVMLDQIKEIQITICLLYTSRCV